MFQSAVILIVASLAGSSFQDPGTGEVSPDVERRLRETGESVKVWIEFVDKALSDGEARAAALRQLESTYPERAKQRRRNRRSLPGLFDERDLPLARSYVAQLEVLGIPVHVEARWLNSVSATVSAEQLEVVRSLPCVRRVHLVARSQLLAVNSLSAPPTAGYSFYGASQGQLDQIRLAELHGLGFTGHGIVVGILDTGFALTHDAFNDSSHPLDVLGAYDFVNDDSDVGPEPGDDPGQHAHGTLILGTLGAYLPDVLVGGAYDAGFLLAKTEDITDETAAEEDFYVAGLEWIELNGGDVATSSLGYIDWYTQSDLDGQTATTTIAVNIATANGVFCCTAAGNGGNDSDPATSHLIAPSDAFEVFACGSVAATGEPSSFSSDGPTADGRVKPELMAQGESTWTVSPWDDHALTSASGTSLSTPLIASVVACLAEAGPAWDVTTMRERLLRTSSMFSLPVPDPLFVYGYGIADAVGAAQLSGGWQDLGGGVAGVNGVPTLMGTGSLVGTEPISLQLDSAKASSSYFMVVGLSTVNLPFRGGTLVPTPDLILIGLQTDASGSSTLTAPWIAGLPDAFSLYFQAWMADAAAILGMSGSNGLQATTPSTNP